MQEIKYEQIAQALQELADLVGEEALDEQQNEEFEELMRDITFNSIEARLREGLTNEQV